MEWIIRSFEVDTQSILLWLLNVGGLLGQGI
jgi:hypothetical protein